MIDLYLILFIISITYGINYVLPVFYMNNCRGLFSFNSPPCVFVLTFMTSNSYLHLYIHYAIALYFGGKFLKYIKNIISVKNDA